jgi:hypothetical protein
MVLQGLKQCIFNHLRKFTGKWASEVPTVLWSLRTSPNCSIGFTPFFMVYDAEAMLLTDLDYGVPRVEASMKEGWRNRCRTCLTSSTRRMTWHYSVRPSTSRPFTATTVEMFEVEHSR